MIWGSSERDPLSGDGIKTEMQGADPEEVEVANEQLDELLDFFKCQDLLPLAERILWLSDVKEALGYIPENFNLTYYEIFGLVLLGRERSLYESYEAYKARKKGDAPPPPLSPKLSKHKR